MYFAVGRRFLGISSSPPHLLNIQAAYLYCHFTSAVLLDSPAPAALTCTSKLCMLQTDKTFLNLHRIEKKVKDDASRSQARRGVDTTVGVLLGPQRPAARSNGGRCLVQYCHLHPDYLRTRKLEPQGSSKHMNQARNSEQKAAQS